MHAEAPVGPAAAVPRARVSATTVVAVVVLALALLHGWRWAFLCDDAFISFRYADHLARFGELAFNVAPLERVEGYTNFAWVVALAVGERLGLAPPDAAMGLGMLALGAIGMLAFTLVRVLGGDARFAVVALGLVAASPEVVVWGTSGLETAAAAAAVLGTIAAWHLGRVRTAGSVAALAVLLRPDAVVMLGAWALAWLSLEGRAYWRAPTRPPVRVLLQAAALAIVPVAVHLLWRRVYYGTWTPNTWAVKAHGAALRDTWGVAYVQAWSSATWLPYLAWVLPLLRRRALPLLACAVASVLYAWSVGGDFMAYSRFLVVASVLLAVLIALALSRASELLRRRWPRARAGTAALLAMGGALAIGLAWQADRRFDRDRAKPEGWLDGKWEGVTAMHRFAAVGVAAGAWLAQHVPPDTVITVGAAGAVPYASGLPTIDAFGLVDPEIPRMSPPPLRPGSAVRPGHQLFAPPEYIRARDPDLLCHVGFRGSQPPREAEARPPFRSGYAWACVQPGADAAMGPGGERFDPGVYCCRRPRDRVVGPFGAAESAHE